MNEQTQTHRGWKVLRRVLVALAVFITLVAAFYAEEDWRGKRAWEKCKAELEAKGAVMDWDKYMPPSVPDSQNFFTASTNILLRFVKQQDQARMDAVAQLSWLRLGPTSSNSFSILTFSKTNSPVVAELTVLLSVSTKNDAAINLNDSLARDKIQNLIRMTVGRSVNGSQGFQFSELQLSNLSPAKIVLLADAPPSAVALEDLIAPDLFTNIGRLAVMAAADPKKFQVKFITGRITAAADYLEWSDQFVPAFDEVREALKRPYAIIPGDYSQPFMQPIPNFVTLRALAQTLAQRAQCDLLAGRPDQALHELTLIHDICRILKKPPFGKSTMLVESMINVAISGLYASMIQDGLRLNAWREPQLTALQEQCRDVDLITAVADSFSSERAASAHTIETTPASKIAEFFNHTVVVTPGSSLWKRMQVPAYLFFKFCPRGWIYQNMVTVVSYARFEPQGESGQPLKSIPPKFIDQSLTDLEKSLNRQTPFNVWARIAIPNFSKAWQTTAYNQTLINEAQIACALERFKLVHENYPETLDALVPQFVEKLPNDIIGGQPLHYRRTDDGRFLLYSVGWNETDDGETPGVLADVKKGDWVWKN